ncbi:MAG: glycosyltransferase family 2 protein [Coleofasciculaceae cyanobacterium SM2_1_6]|nr:glycosyltransferase family 2 protein [Coleofasciculaceae cyanobacterium SM2_1_6]
MDITIAIPTYNGAARLPEVLQQLQRQVDTERIAWEILVVDNNSSDNLPAVISHYQTLLPRLRYCQELKQGAGFARHRAFGEAQGELVAFLDDDTIPDRHWVSAVADFAQTHPQAGAYGSQIHADYAVPPPPNFARIAPFLAITERGSIPLLYKKNSRLLPPSAGLVVRKAVWQQYIPAEMTLSGRVEGNMLTSEDLEMLSYIQGSPWEIWYNPAMEITHKIPAARLERDYLIPFLRGIGYSRYVTRTIATHGIKKYLLTLAYMVNDLKKILLHLLKHRTKVKTDLVAACELELLTSSLISPFFLWRKGYLKGKR